MTNIRVTDMSGAKNPSLALEGAKTCLAFGAGDTVYFTTAGSRPVKVAEAGHLALGMRRGPRLALSRKTLVISAVYGRQGGGRDGELLSWRSTDSGKTWQGPSTVSDVPGAAREGLHAMAASSDGTLACAWLDLRAKGTSVFASVSTDGGKTWSRNALVYRSPDGTVCECCHTSVAFTPGGEMLVMFRNVLKGNRDMYLCRSRDGGKTFSLAEKLGLGTWPLNACPMDGGAIASDARGRIGSAWRREDTVYTCAPGQPERAVEIGQQPWVAAGRDGFWSAWLVGRPGRLRVQSPSGAIRTIAEGANDPVLASSGGNVALAWTASDGLWMNRLS